MEIEKIRAVIETAELMVKELGKVDESVVAVLLADILIELKRDKVLTTR